MDKLRVTSHIIDLDVKNKMYKIIDLCNNVLKNHTVKQSDFLNPFEIKNAISIINSEEELNYRVEGGYSNSERAILVIFPFYHEYSESDSKLSYIQVEGNFKFTSLSHKDYLGALMGLGLKREKIGDILVHESFCQIILKDDISDYLLFNFDKVGRNSVSVKEIKKEDIKLPKVDFEEKNIIISSLRADNIISTVFGISRNSASKLINGGYLYIDYEKIQNTSKNVEIGSLISLRKHGRFYLCEITNLTKKGNYKIKIKKYRK